MYENMSGLIGYCDKSVKRPTVELNSMYEGAGGTSTGGDTRLLGLEVVRVAPAAPVREQKAPLGVLVHGNQNEKEHFIKQQRQHRQNLRRDSI